MIERKCWAEGHRVEHSAQKICAECSTQFPRSDSFLEEISFFKQKMQHRFPSVAWHLPLRERYEPQWLCLDRTLNAKFDHWGSLRRTFRSFTSTVVFHLVNDLKCEQVWP